jgi:hypothetical protein
MGIYGDGVTHSPHFLSSPMSLLEIFQKWPKLLGPHDIAKLVVAGQIHFDEGRGSFVVTPPKVVAAAPTPAKAAKKRSKKR